MKKIIVMIVLSSILFSGCSDFIRWQWRMRGVSEDGRRETFEKTKSYNEGKEQDLLKYRLEYIQADESGKEAIAFTIRHMFADYDETKLSPELRDFLKEIKYGGF